MCSELGTTYLNLVTDGDLLIEMCCMESSKFAKIEDGRSQLAEFDTIISRQTRLRGDGRSCRNH